MKKPILRTYLILFGVMSLQMISLNQAHATSQLAEVVESASPSNPRPEKIQLIKNNGKTRTIPHFKSVKVWIRDSDQPIKGKYEVVNDSTISIGGEVVRLADIQKISGFTWPSLFAPALLASGGTGLGFGVVYLVFGGFTAYAGYGAGLLAAGAVLSVAGTAAIAGGIVILYYSKTYRNVGEKWQVQISS